MPLAWAGGRAGHWKLDETSGTTAYDSTVNLSNGTLQNAPVWTSDCSASGLQVNGTSQYVSVPNSSNLSLTKAVTLTGWVKSSDLSGWHAVVNKGASGTNSNYYLSTKDNQASFGFYNAGWSEFTTTTANLQSNTWYHLAATFDNSTDEVRVYVNGAVILSTTTSATPVINSQNLLIGSNEANEYWNGMLRDVRIYNCVLGSAEIAALSGVVGHWKFAEGTGTTAADSSGSGKQRHAFRRRDLDHGLCGQQQCATHERHRRHCPNGSSLYAAVGWDHRLLDARVGTTLIGRATVRSQRRLGNPTSDQRNPVVRPRRIAECRQRTVFHARSGRRKWQVVPYCGGV